ncbi:MAG: Ig-like domain-containing protein, partial [Planctomycetes bacterium]|nr:Ig-like domain-containing protein [Planctomycetota bacterium]
MVKKLWFNLLLVLGIAAGWASAQSLVPIDPATVTNGHAYLMDNVGANVPDDSANNVNGNLVGSPQIVAGLNGNALKLNGTSDGVHIPDAATINTSVHQNKTIIVVFNCANVGKTEKQVVFEEGGSTRGISIYVHQGLVYAAGWNKADYTPQWTPGTFLSAPIGSNEWHAVAAVLRGGDAGQKDDKFEMWLDGKLIGKGPGGELRSRSDDTGVGTVRGQTMAHDAILNAGFWFEGLVDEIWILNQALAPDVLGAIGVSATKASDPVPANGATDVPRDVTVSWTPSESAGTHDVYWGTAFNDVNAASRADPKGVLVGQGQTATQYDPAGQLQYGQTYYWRIDEVNATADQTIFKGETWSFTVEPYGYPVKPVAATASSSQAGMGPEKTIDGSGLTGDLHGTVETTMWTSAGVPPNWIQYEFDRVYRL